jgi:hypothetical protein
MVCRKSLFRAESQLKILKSSGPEAEQSLKYSPQCATRFLRFEQDHNGRLPPALLASQGLIAALSPRFEHVPGRFAWRKGSAQLKAKTLYNDWDK